VSVRG